MEIPKYSYTISYYPDEGDECYVCRSREFPSISTHGDSPQEALYEMVTFVMPMVVEMMLEDGEPLPEPIFE